MIADTASWLEQTLAGGRYRVTGLLGEGGMGRVYRAQDRNLDCDVVIKVPRRAMLEDAEFAARFTRENRSLVKLSHPHIVKIYDVGEHDGVPFAVLQFLAGGSLRDRQKTAPNGKPLPLQPDDLSAWLDQVAAALDFIHQQGYIHRDVKPDNILFDGHGNVYLSDFGVAKVLADKSAQKQKTVMTGEGMVLGTPQYMSPELVMGQACDGRVDQYALAVMVFELLTGTYPVDGPTATAIFVEKATKEAPPLAKLAPALPPGLTAALQKALSRDPKSRFQDCASFAKAARQAPVAPAAPAKPSTQEASIKFACPKCEKILVLPAKGVGRQFRCPRCGRSFTMTLPAPVAPAAMPQASVPTAPWDQSRVPTQTAAAVAPPNFALPPLAAQDFGQAAAAGPSSPNPRRNRMTLLILSGMAALVLVGTAVGLSIYSLGGKSATPAAKNDPDTTVAVVATAPKAPAEKPAPKPEETQSTPTEDTPKPKQPPEKTPDPTPTPKKDPPAKTPRNRPGSAGTKGSQGDPPAAAVPAETSPKLEPSGSGSTVTKPKSIGPRRRVNPRSSRPTPDKGTSTPAVGGGKPAPTPAPRPVEKAEVPNRDSQKIAEASIKESFKSDYGRIDVGSGKSFLAEKLLRAGTQQNSDKARQFVLLREARDLACQVGKLKLAWDAVEATIGAFQVDTLDLQAATLESVFETAAGAECRLVADKALTLVDEAVLEDRYDQARRLVEVADKAARKGTAPKIIERVESRRKEVDAEVQAFDQAEKARRKLQDKPDDPEANAVVGRHDALHKGDWDNGLVALAAGNDPTLRALASKDLDNPDSPKAQVEMGDAWWNLALKEKGLVKTHLQERAQFWYEQAVEQLTGAEQARVQARLKQAK